MALWDNVSNVLSGGGRNDINNAYRDANNNFTPYTTGGATDYNTLRSRTANQGNNLDRFSNAGDWMYSHINESPNDYYQGIMGGYSESPEAKYAQEKAYNASTRGASASGMLGSGAQLRELQENANRISQGDKQQYFNNAMTSGNQQFNALGNLQGQQDQLQQMLQYLTKLGYGANTQVSQNQINQGNANAQIDQSAIDSIMGLIGAGGQNIKNNSMSPNASSIPWYLMAA